MDDMLLDFTDRLRWLIRNSCIDICELQFDIKACDDLDKLYSVRITDGQVPWIEHLSREGYQLEDIYAPEEGIIDVRVRKRCPEYNSSTPENFKKEIESYFNSIAPFKFRFTEEIVTEKVDTSFMAHNSEGDEIGWVERESDAYVGTVFSLEYPIVAGEPFLTELSDENTAFILRKLEDIFKIKGAWFRRTGDNGVLWHYEFRLATF